MACQERERAKRKGAKFDAKLYLIRKLYDRGYTAEQIRALLKFIDWVLQLSPEEDEIVSEEIKKLEEVKKMPSSQALRESGLKKVFPRWY